MAEHEPVYELGSTAEIDYGVHEHTYRAFLRATKYGVAAVVIILVLMAIFLT
jgi:hypothetical protein